MGRFFNSTGDRLRLNSAEGASPKGSISIWIKPHWSSGDGLSHFFWWLFDGSAADSDTKQAPSFFKYLDNNVYVGINYGAGDFRISIADTGIFSNGVWAHHLFTWDDATDEQFYYVNNVLKGSNTSSAFTMPAYAGLIIGMHRDSAQSYASASDLAEFARWNRVLTSGERADLAAGKSAAYISSGLKRYYRILGTTPGAIEPEFYGAETLPVTGTTKSADDPTITDVPILGGKSIVQHRPSRVVLPAPSLRDGLKFYWDARVAINRDLVRGGRKIGATNGLGTARRYKYGQARVDPSFTNATTVDMEFASGPFTLATFFRLVSGPSSSFAPEPFARYTYTNEGSNSGWLIGQVGGPGIGSPGANKFIFVCFRNNAFGTYRLESGTSWVAGRDWLIVGTSDGTTRRIYVNGVEDGNTTNNANPLGTVGGELLMAHTPAGQDGLTAGYWNAAWTKCLSPGDVRWLWANRATGLRNVQRPVMKVDHAPARMIIPAAF